MIDFSTIAHSITLLYSYLFQSVNGNSCEYVWIEGNTLMTSKDSFFAYLKDARPTFTIISEDFSNYNILKS